MKHILIGIDFSPASVNAFDYAARMAVAYGSRLTLVHAYQPAMLEPYVDHDMEAALLKQQEKIALTHFARLKDHLPTRIKSYLTFEFRIELGVPTETLLRLRKEVSPDLIVIGAQGGNPLMKRLLGSTAQTMIQRAEYPLLLIPEEAKFHKLSRIAYATDYKEDDIRVIDDVLYFAKQNHAKLTCVHVRDKASIKEAYQQELLKRTYYYDLTHANIDFETITHDNVVEGLQHYMEWEQINMMVMLTHHRNRIEQLFHKSHCKQLSLQTDVPLWIYPMNQDKAPLTL